MRVTFPPDSLVVSPPSFLFSSCDSSTVYRLDVRSYLADVAQRKGELFAHWLSDFLNAYRV